MPPFALEWQRDQVPSAASMGAPVADIPAIHTTQLTKVYPGSGRLSEIAALQRLPGIFVSPARPPVRAIDSLDLRVERGEIFGFLGPNGAGKTTTIRLLLDLIRPTRGGATVLGLDAQRDSVELHRQIGFLPAELNLWKNQRADRILRYLASVRGDEKSLLEEAARLAARLELDMTRRIRAYSSGNRRKLGLVIAMMHKPELLILDEPSSGLDPLMQQTFYQLMREARDEGRTVFLSSHVLSEVQTICDRVGILRDGRLRAVETVEALTHVEFRRIHIRTREAISPELLMNVPGVAEVKVDGCQAELQLRGDFDPLLRVLAGCYVEDLRQHDPTLEEIFLAYYGDAPVVSQ